MATIKADTRPTIAAFHALSGGKFRIRLNPGHSGPGTRVGAVLDDDGNRIGSAHDWPYKDRGFSVHTRPFAGFVPREQIEFVQDEYGRENVTREDWLNEED
jgi:hypothetical protein